MTRLMRLITIVEMRESGELGLFGRLPYKLVCYGGAIVVEACLAN